MIGAFLESLGVSLVIPFIAAITDPASLDASSFGRAAKAAFGLGGGRDFAVFLTVALILVFVVKNAFLYLISLAQQGFVNKGRYRLSRRMMGAFLGKPYEYFLDTSSAEVQSLLSSQVVKLYVLVSNLISLVAEAATMAFFVVLVFFVNQSMTLVMLTLLVVLTLILRKVLKPRIAAIGKECDRSFVRTIRSVQEAMGGIKEVKALAREAHFLETYSAQGRLNLELDRKRNVYSMMPRYLTETICVSGVLAYILVMLLQGMEVGSMVSQISAFALIAMRLMPGSTRINGYLNQIGFHRTALDALEKHFGKGGAGLAKEEAEGGPPRAEEPPLPFTEAVELKGVRYSYPSSDWTLFESLDIRIPKGKSVGLVGQSGCGKTTAVDLLLGLLSPASGAVLVDGLDIAGRKAAWTRMVGYIPQSIFLLDDTIRANVAFGYPGADNDETVWRALENAQIAEIAKRGPKGLDEKVGERGIKLSGGQRQRLGIARAIFHDPEILVFDEATSALDGDTEAEVMAAIRLFHGTKTMLIVAHRLSTLADCDLVYEIAGGEAREITETFMAELKEAAP